MWRMFKLAHGVASHRTHPAILRALSGHSFDEADRQLVRRDLVPIGAPDLHRRLRAAALVGEPQPGVVEVPSPPLEHRPDDGHELGALASEDVLVPAALTGLSIGLRGARASPAERGK